MDELYQKARREIYTAWVLFLTTSLTPSFGRSDIAGKIDTG